MRYYSPEDGEWFAPSRRRFKIACCDCGLVHRWQFRIVKRELQMRTWRDTRATAAKRRHRTPRPRQRRGPR